MDPRLLLGGVLETPIANPGEATLDFSFNEFSPNPNVLSGFMPEFYATDDSADGYNYVLNWIVKYGIGQNIPAPYVDLDSGITLQDTYLNLGSASNEFDFKRSRMKIELSTRSSTFFDLAEGLNLRSFYQESSFVKTRYVREKVPDYVESAILQLAIYMAVQQVIETVKNTIEAIRGALPRSTTDVGLGPSIFLVALANTLYLAAILIALFQLLRDLSDAIFGKPKAYYAIDVKDVLFQGCQELGYELKSTELDALENLTFMAATTEEGVLRGKPTNNPLPNVSLLQFFNMIGGLVNGKLKAHIGEGIVEFEKRTTYQGNPSPLVLQDIWDKGTFAYNTEELNQAISIQFANAFTDGNITDNKYTVMFINDDIVENVVQAPPSEVSDAYRDILISLNSQKIYSNLKNKLEINMSMAPASRKVKEKPLEKQFNSIFDIVTGINKDAKLDVGERKGLMLLETDRVPVNLIYFRDEQKVAQRTTDYFTARNIFKEHYQIETPYENQYVTYTNRGEEPLLNSQTVLALINNNVALNENGQTVSIIKNIKDPETDLHLFEYKQKLSQGDFGFIEDQNFTVFEVQNSSPERKQFTWKAFLNSLLT